MITTTASQERERRVILSMIRAGQKITGARAIRAGELGIGEVFRSGNGEFALSVVSLGRRTPPGTSKTRGL